MVIMEPVQNSGGSFMPPAGYFEGVRALCDEHGILLCADEVITGFGRTGHWFASERFDIRPDLITSAKGLSSAYAAIGALIASERVMEPFEQAGRDVHARDDVRRPPGAGRGRAQEHRDHEARAASSSTCASTEADFRAALERLLELPIVGDVRGCGYFYAIELVKDKETRASFDDEECDELLRGFVSPRAVRARPALPRRRPRRSRRPDLAAARGRARRSSTSSRPPSAAVLEEAGERMRVAA